VPDAAQLAIVADFLVAACAPHGPGASHASGTLERAEEIRKAHPEVATADVYTAAVLGDAAAVGRFLALDPGAAARKGGPHAWDPLTHLCFSRYLRLDKGRSGGFVRAAETLLDAGASPSTGFYEREHQPKPAFESVLYGAAGVAHHPGLTRLLLERGADPNDEEVPYHAPEGYDNAALEVLVQSGRLTAESLAWMLLRKVDWHDHDGLRFLLEHGARPTPVSARRTTPLHHALRRDNALATIELLLDHGADPTFVDGWDGRSAVSIAARRGRSDVLEAFERRGVPIELAGVERLIAACARNDASAVRSIAEHEPELVQEAVAQGGTLLAEFAGVGNAAGVECLLDLGVDVNAVYTQGDGYFGIPPFSTALHVAAWRSEPATVAVLIERGAAVDARDGAGRTALALAVNACVDSYWTERRSPASVEALLRAGASVGEIPLPSGYAAVDELLRRSGEGA
jgi:ankyrin repeat protein